MVRSTACLGNGVLHLPGSLLSKARSLSRKEARFRNIDRKFWFVSQGGDANIQDNEALLDDLLDALLDERLVVLTYLNRDGEEKKGTFAPLSVVVYQHQLYLVARHADATLRPLRLSRIQKVEASEPFTYPTRDQFDPQSVFSKSFGVWLSAEEAVAISIRLDPAWATHARTHRWHASQRVRVDKSGVYVTLRCRHCPELEQWVLSFGEQAEVLKPLALRKKIAARVAALAACYTSPRPVARRAPKAGAGA